MAALRRTRIPIGSIVVTFLGITLQDSKYEAQIMPRIPKKIPKPQTTRLQNYSQAQETPKQAPNNPMKPWIYRTLI